MLSVDSLEGTVAEHRIKEIAAKGNEEQAVYKLKPNSKKMNKSFHRYSQEQLSHVKRQCQEFNYFFGYADKPG